MKELHCKKCFRTLSNHEYYNCLCDKCIADNVFGSIDIIKYNKQQRNKSVVYEILKKFDNIFIVCPLSLCEEHKDMRCEKCRIRDFLGEEINKLLESFDKYEKDMYGPQENIKNLTPKI
jgi:hypothetical protein